MRKTSEENGRKSSAGSGKPSYSASEKRTFKPASDSKRTFGKSEPKNETKSRFSENSQSGKKSVGDYRKPERTAERPTYKKIDSKPGFTDKKGGSNWESPKKSFTKPEGNSRFSEKRDFRPRTDGSEPKRAYGNRSEKPDGGRYEGKKEFKPRTDNREGQRFEPKREFGDRNQRPEGVKYEGKREFKPRTDNREGQRFEPKREFGDRNQRPEGGKYEGKREFKPRTDNREGQRFEPKREFGDRSVRSEGGRFEEKREFKPRTENREGQRFEPKREFGDRNQRPDGGRFDKKPFNKPEYRPEKKFDKDDNYGKRKFSNTNSVANPQSHEWSRQVGLSIKPDYEEENLRKKLPPKVQAKIEKSERSRPETVRLNRFLANAGLCSRREADEMIASGQITVNGETITEMGYQVKTTDVVKYGRKILNREKFVYVLLNKPKDFLTTTEDPEGRKTVMDLVKNACTERIYPVGRLDRATTGLLLLTNDGELADKLSHPSNNMKKIYQVEIDKPIVQDDFDKILEGIELEDGTIKADDLSVITPDHQVVGIEIHSGKNRIVRRIFESLGYEVTKLDRTTYAGLSKKDLPRGNWRFLTEKEVIRLKYLI
ncbi:MAG: pseudouridine synthase [Cytophagaceae bacterium]|nr:pseudouridine synthase [Cytophagaceae bacterium]